MLFSWALCSNVWKRIPPVSSCQRTPQDMCLWRGNACHKQDMFHPGFSLRLLGFLVSFAFYPGGASPMRCPFHHVGSHIHGLFLRRILPLFFPSMSCDPTTLFSAEQSASLEVLRLFAPSWARPHCHLFMVVPTIHSSSLPRLVPRPGQRGGLVPFFSTGELGSPSSALSDSSPRYSLTTTPDPIPPGTWCRRRGLEGSDRRLRR